MAVGEIPLDRSQRRISPAQDGSRFARTLLQRPQLRGRKVTGTASAYGSKGVRGDYKNDGQHDEASSVLALSLQNHPMLH
jgi:hypothetical protein